MRSDHVVRILRAPGGRLAHGFLGGLDGLIHEFPGSPSGVSQRLLSTLDIFLPAIHGVIPSGPTLFGSLVQFILGLGYIVAQGGAIDDDVGLPDLKLSRGAAVKRFVARSLYLTTQ